MKSLILLFVLAACTKEEITAPLQFRMNGRLHQFNEFEAIAFSSCGLRIYQVSALKGEAFFKINFTDHDTLQPGVFAMGEQATNNIPGTATFWYTHQGHSYTARPFVVTVHSYQNNRLQASFTGGVVSDGIMNLTISEQ